MGTRYSKRQADGTVEYYDSREEMEKANQRSEISFRDILIIISGQFNPLLAFFGFLIGGSSSLWFLSSIDTWPTWIRFLTVLASASATGYITGKIGNALFFLVIAISVIAVICGFSALVWHLL
jgi:hypothetical protein